MRGCVRVLCQDSVSRLVSGVVSGFCVRVLCQGLCKGLFEGLVCQGLHRVRVCVRVLGQDSVFRIVLGSAFSFCVRLLCLCPCPGACRASLGVSFPLLRLRALFYSITSFCSLLVFQPFRSSLNTPCRSIC